MTRDDEELVKALRNSYGYSEQRDKEAAAAIERLSAENAELREALQNWHEPHPDELPKPPEEGK